MVGMGLKSRQNSMGSPRSEVGEIDTRAPFQSVRAAVSLFGEGSAQKEKPLFAKMTKPSTERVLVKETQLHLAEKELDKLKNKLKSAENTKTRGLSDLEKAKRTLEDLNSKLNAVSQSKAAATEATQAAKSRAKQLEKAHFQQLPQSPSAWRQELDRERDQYRTASNELGILKLELRKIQQDFDSFLEAKIMAFQQAADAQHAIKNNREKVSELSKDIAAMQESLAHVKLATAKAKEDHRKIVAERDLHQQSHRAAVEDIGKKLQSLNKEFDPEIVTDLEGKLEEVTEEIEVLQAKTKAAKAACVETLRILNLELEDAKMALQMATEEDSSLRSIVDSLHLELQGVKKDCIELQVKEAETEIVSRNLQVDVEQGRAELEIRAAEESKAREAVGEMVSAIQQLLSESRAARLEVEEMKKNTEELNGEVETLGIKTKELEGKLEVAQGEAAEARAAEKIALENMKMKDLPWRENAPDYQAGNPPTANTESADGGKIKLSMEEFESLTRKVEESNTLGESKVETVMAEMEAIKLRENEAVNQLDSRLKEMEAMEAATEEALKQAEMAEDAKQAVEKELQRWHEQKHNITPAASLDS